MATIATGRFTAYMLTLMNVAMLARIYKFKIFGAIIKPVTILVMNVLGAFQWTSENALHNYAMLKPSCLFPRNIFVSVMNGARTERRFSSLERIAVPAPHLIMLWAQAASTEPLRFSAVRN